MMVSMMFRLCVLLGVLGALAAPRTANAGPGPVAAFTFGVVDLKLLEQVELFDASLEKEGLLFNDRALTAYLTSIGHSIVGDRPAPERVTWRFRAIRDPLPNAFALPNGSIYVHTGLLGVLETEAQLAAVLAHEVNHVLERHTYLSYRGYRKRSATIAIVSTAARVAGRSDIKLGQTLLILEAVVPVILTATMAGYNRELERQADLQAVDALIASHHDASGMADAFRLLQATHDLESETIFYTDHPKLQARIEYVTEHVQRRARPPLAPEFLAARGETFLAAVERARRHNVQLAIDANRHRSAVAFARKLVEYDPASSDHVYLLAEAYRELGPRTATPDGRKLGPRDKQREQVKKRRLTPAEQERELLSSPEGQAAWRENQQQAEDLYRRALELDSTNYRVHRGLGLLSEETGQTTSAVNAYQTYLALAVDPPDRKRIQRRIAMLTGSPQPPE
jgi:predicted Zn-dependent protease